MRQKANPGTPLADPRFEHQLPVDFSLTNNFTALPDVPRKAKKLVDDMSTTLCDFGGEAQV